MAGRVMRLAMLYTLVLLLAPADANGGVAARTYPSSPSMPVAVQCRVLHSRGP